MRTLALLIVCSGCQCLVPVPEGEPHDGGGLTDAGHDAGVDAGFDAGVDAGPALEGWDGGQACEGPTDCSGLPHIGNRCSEPQNGVWSCVDRRCVAECGDNGGQTCTVEEPIHCLVCAAGGSCIPPSCFTGDPRIDFHVEELTCVDEPPLAVGEVVTEHATSPDGGSCSYTFTLGDGGTLGYLYLQTARSLSADVSLLGGTCLAYDLATGAPRLMLDCPRCQVVLGP